MGFDDPEHASALTSPSWSHCEGLIKAFERAWLTGPAPAISDFLRGDGRMRRALLIELIHVDLEFRLKSGGTIAVERYFSDFPELAEDRRAALSVIVAEFDLLRRSGSAVRAPDYARRFPDLQSDLEML